MGGGGLQDRRSGPGLQPLSSPRLNDWSFSTSSSRSCTTCCEVYGGKLPESNPVISLGPGPLRDSSGRKPQNRAEFRPGRQEEQPPANPTCHSPRRVQRGHRPWLSGPRTGGDRPSSGISENRSDLTRVRERLLESRVSVPARRRG